MPIKVPDHLPAKRILRQENIFVMDESRAFHQDIRSLSIAILNLMPFKQATEVQLLRLLGNTPLQIDITLMHMGSHISKNTSSEYLATFYQTFEGVRHRHFDGMIITGAPVEKMPFEQVNYWQELCAIMEWTNTHVTATLHICWGAQAGLYYHYGIPKYPLPQKLFGIFPHTKTRSDIKILRGFDDVFYAPHSRHTEIRSADIEKIPALEILSTSAEAGIFMVAARKGRQIFVTGHSEYDPLTLSDEYKRDLAKGEPIAIPVNYFPNNDPICPPLVIWRAHGSLLFTNWLNYYVYQETPFDWDVQIPRLRV